MSTQTIDKKAFMNIIEDRKSVKKYDSSHKMTKVEIRELLESTQKAPSAWNLQHWKFLVLEDQEAKDKAVPIAYGQQQVKDASIVVCILADQEANKNADPVFDSAIEAGAMTKEVKDMLVNQIESVYKIPGAGREQGVLNSSLAAMQLMLTAKAMGYDSCPMSGFNPAKMIEEFNIPERYIPTMLISVGKGTEPARPSGRLDIDDVTIWNTF